MGKVPVVEFKGRRWLRVGNALTTAEDFKLGICSYAHIYPDCILRYGVKVGEPSELKVVGEEELPEPEPQAFDRILSDGGGWTPLSRLHALLGLPDAADEER